MVPPGTYSLTVRLSGFTGAKLDEITLPSFQTTEIPVVMQVGAPETVVLVSAHSSEIDTKSPTIRSTLPKTAIQELPVMTGLQARSALDQLQLLFAGASSSRLTGHGDSHGDTLTVNGSVLGAVGFYVDGLDNGWEGGYGAVTIGPNPDAIEELTVLTQNFGAEAGGYQAQVHWHTRRGTNELHGLFRALQLNPRLGARDFFDGEKSSSPSTNAVGFNLGGPLVVPGVYDGRNRTFWFYDTEWTRYRLRTPVTNQFPENAERAGDFSRLPSALWPVDPLTGDPFPGGRVPESRIVPQARYYVDQFIPTAPDGGMVTSMYDARMSGYQFTTRLEHHIRESETVSGSIFLYKNGTKENDAVTLGNTGDYPEHGHNISLQYSRRLSPRTTNSLTVGNSRWAGAFVGSGKFTGVDLTKQGYNIHHLTSAPGGFPNVALESNSFSPGGMRYEQNVSIFHGRDDFSFLTGKHAWKFGGEVRQSRGQFVYTGGFPSFQFSSSNPSGTGIDFADLLLGIPTGYSQGTDDESRNGRFSTAAYVQDDVAIRPRLTLNLGLRYEFRGASHNLDMHNGVFRPGSRSRVFPNAPAGILFSGDFDPLLNRTIDGSITVAERTDFAPRVGIAWSPGFANGPLARLFGGPGRSSVRAGWGMFYTAARSSPNELDTSMPPWAFSVARDRSALDASGGTLANPWGKDWDPFTGTVEQRQFYPPLQWIPYAEPGLRGPRQQQWTLSFQRQFPAELVMEVGYLGNRAVHLMRSFAANPAIVTADANRFNVESRRAYRDFGHVYGYSGDGTSVYHGLQISMSRRYAARLLLNLHYVWSRTLDDAGGIGVFPFADRAATPWGRANFDRTHNFNGYWILDLPGWKTSFLGRTVFSGWKLSGDIQIRSGLPLQIRNGFDSTLQGFASNMPDIVGSFESFDPRLVRTFTLPTGRTATGNFLFDPSVFRTVNPGSASEARIGNLGRNVFTGPGAVNVDLSVLKEFRSSDRHRFVLRMDATNAFNHAQFVAGLSTMTNTQGLLFGRMTSTSGARRVQIQVRYSF